MRACHVLRKLEPHARQFQKIGVQRMTTRSFAAGSKKGAGKESPIVPASLFGLGLVMAAMYPLQATYADEPTPGGVGKVCKLVALDLDGTTLKSDNTIAEETVAQIAAFRKQGGVVVLATGQGSQGAEHSAKKCGIKEGFLISSGGAVIKKLSNNEWQTWGQFTVDNKIINRLIPAIQAQIPEIQSICEFEKVWITDSEDFFANLNFVVAHLGDKVRRISKIVPALEPYLRASEDEAIRVMMLFPQAKRPTSELMQIATPLADLENAANIESAHVCITPAGADGTIQISRVGVGKSQALTAVCKELGIHPDEVMAFGDNENDNGMLQWAGWGVAMGNAVPTTKAAANEITTTNNENGVAVKLASLAENGYKM